MLGNKQEILGIDLGRSKMKLALMKGLAVRRTVLMEMPDNSLTAGRVSSPALLGNLLKETLRQSGIRAKNCAIVIPDDAIIIRNVNMPKMSEDQMKYNLPFEFRDYIQGELREYVFDYELVAREKADRGSGRMRLLAVSMQRAVLEELRSLARYAGLQLVMAAPVACAFEGILHDVGADDADCCFADIGFANTRLYMFRGVHYVATHTLDSGISRAVENLADEFRVDEHLAATYLETNYENCSESPGLRDVFEDITAEIERALNFFEFNNPDVSLSRIFLCGGGSMIPALVDMLRERLNIETIPARELFESPRNGAEKIGLSVQAAGITRN